MAYGIDFGTTNSAVSFLKDGDITVTSYEPTVIHYDGDDDTFRFGEDARRHYLTMGMEGRFIRSIKSVLSSPNFQSTQLGHKRYTAIDLTAMMLRYLKQRGDRVLGGDIRDVVLGRPVQFNDDPDRNALAEKRLLAAAHQAGFESVDFLYEPVAAAYDYKAHLKQPALIMIGDFGGGTSDFTIIRLIPGHMPSPDDILASSGTKTGGDDVDTDIVQGKLGHHFGIGMDYYDPISDKQLPIPLFFSRLKKWEDLAFFNTSKIRGEIDQYKRLTHNDLRMVNMATLLAGNLSYPLFESAENAKKLLSDTPQANIVFQQGDLTVDQSISNDELAGLIDSRVRKIRDSYHHVLANAGLLPHDIDRLVLTGGTSRIQPIRAIFENDFEANKIVDHDVFNGVVRGLGLAAATASR